MKKFLSVILSVIFCLLLGAILVGCGDSSDKPDPYLTEAQGLIRAAIEEHYEGKTVTYINETWGKPNKNEFKDATVEEDALGGHTKAFFDHHYMFSVEFFVTDAEHNIEFNQVQYQYYVKDELKYLNDNALFSYPIIQRIMDGECKGTYGHLTNNYSLYAEGESCRRTFYYYGEQGVYEQYKGEDGDITGTAFSVTVVLKREGAEIERICFFEDFDGTVEIPDFIGGAPVVKANVSYEHAYGKNDLNVTPDLYISEWVEEITYLPYYDNAVDRNAILNRYKGITVDEANEHYYSGENGNCIIESDTHKLMVIGNSCTAIPSTVTTIDENAFSYNNEIVEITLPENITSVRITNCPNLKKINLNGAKAVISACPNLEYIITNNRSNSGWARDIFNCPNLDAIYIELVKGDTLTNLVFDIYEDVRHLFVIYSEVNPSTIEEPEDFGTSYDSFEAWKALYRWWHYDTDGKTPVIWE